MKKAMWWFAVLVLLAAPAAARTKTSPLFVIERNVNANVVHYDARLTADGTLDPKEPVIAYWVMLAKDGHRQKLNWIEKKKAYGFTIKPDPSVNGYKMTLVAAPDRQITVKKRRRTPSVPRRSSTAGRPGEDVHQRLRRADGTHSPLYRGVRQRPEDGRGAPRKDGAEVAALIAGSCTPRRHFGVTPTLYMFPRGPLAMGFYVHQVERQHCENPEEQPSNHIDGVMEHAVDSGNRQEQTGQPVGDFHPFKMRASPPCDKKRRCNVGAWKGCAGVFSPCVDKIDHCLKRAALMLVFLFLITSPSRDTSHIIKLVNGFFQDVTAGDYRGAYERLSEVSKKAYTLNDFAQDHVENRINIQNFRIDEVVFNKYDKKEAVAVVSSPFTLYGRETLNLQMIKEEEGWRIVFSGTIFHLNVPGQRKSKRKGGFRHQFLREALLMRPSPIFSAMSG